LRAQTNGGVIAYKEIRLNRVEDPCIYAVKPTYHALVEPYVDGK
jgi:hypothetical protein